MAGVNKAILVGRLGADPEVRYLENGTAVANFSLATSETWKDQEGNKQEKTEWHRVVLWRKQAEVAEKYLKKGSQVYVEGKLQTRSYEQEGVTKYTTEIVGTQMTMLGGGDQQQQPKEAATKESQLPTPEQLGTEDDDDLPF